MSENYAIKVGSGLVTNGNGEINEKFILSVCTQVAEIMERGDMVFIVSSGAIAAGPDEDMSENLKAVIGQPDVFGLYKQFFKVYKIRVGQLLVTDDDLKRGVIQRVMLEALKKRIVLILNANDGTDDKEIKANQESADNDVLTKNVCLLPGIKTIMNGAIFGFDQPGVRDNNKNVIYTVKPEERQAVLAYAKGGSKLGHGKNGARTKFSVAGDLASQGIPTVVVPGIEKDFILRGIERFGAGYKDDFGTLFSF